MGIEPAYVDALFLKNSNDEGWFSGDLFGYVPSLKMNMMASSSLWPTLSPQWPDSEDKKSPSEHQSLSKSGCKR